MFVSPSHRLVFAHYPKTAGTSLADLLKSQLGDLRQLDPEQKHVPVRQGYERLRLRNRTLAWLLLKARGDLRARCDAKVDEPGSLRVLGVIREPFEMAVSLFEYWGRRRTMKDVDNALPEAAVRKDFRRFLEVLASDPEGLLSYERFFDVGGPLWPNTLLVDMGNLVPGLRRAFDELGLPIKAEDLAVLNAAPETDRARRKEREREAGPLADKVRERFGWYYSDGLRLALR